MNELLALYDELKKKDREMVAKFYLTRPTEAQQPPSKELMLESKVEPSAKSEKINVNVSLSSSTLIGEKIVPSDSNINQAGKNS